MSQDITFQKEIKVEDITNKTSLAIKVVNNGEWLVSKSGGTAKLNRTYSNNEYVDSISRYNSGRGFDEIMDEIVLTFQTKFITDQEVELLLQGEKLDIDKLYDGVTTSYGYNINENGVIEKLY